MNRRGFLKACAVLMAAPIIDIPQIRLIVPSQSMLQDETWFSTVREICAYDFRHDFILRYEMLYTNSNGKDEQMGIDIPATYDDLVSGGLKNSRDTAAKLFSNEIRDSGIRIADLKPLPIPPGYIEPEIMQFAREAVLL